MSNSTAEENNAPNHTLEHNPTVESINVDSNDDQLTTAPPATASDDKMTTSTEIIAKGISSMISSVIKDFDATAVATCHSQHHLFSSLDRLTSELDQLLEDAPLPFIMQHAAKLSNVRKRVSSLNSVLRSIQRRLDNIDRMLSVGVPNDQTIVGGSE